ncbi:TetR/AcrR family transcriptional regulator [Corallococcus praedator]|uniref:TetR/AcrR family transcriptional regulator n=1 Tax=Corallococcus praedator TaxID=2316724 RepID=A0ABX9Q5E2_9BACT|nr:MULTISPECIES: TetR/AcrR family transcriptional regulator [Corallococcus]RKH18669.1 TetR/AcrR family transcriptional regulator [Corallococcus sp. CA031C]RKH91766.1 TetR/AcrR family transcriptional regulator [Corallococcus praedator]
MSRPQRVLDSQIDEAARAVFLEQGPAAPLHDIAKRLGISQAALLHRVGTKEALMLRALRPVPPSAVALLAPGPREDASVEDQLLEALLHHRDFLRQLVPWLFVLHYSMLGGARAMQTDTPPPVALREALTTWLSRVKRAGLADLAAPKVVAEALCGVLEARCFNAHVGGATYAPGEDAAVLRQLIRVLVVAPATRSRPAKKPPKRSTR